MSERLKHRVVVLIWRCTWAGVRRGRVCYGWEEGPTEVRVVDLGPVFRRVKRGVEVELVLKTAWDVRGEIKLDDKKYPIQQRPLHD